MWGVMVYLLSLGMMSSKFLFSNEDEKFSMWDDAERLCISPTEPGSPPSISVQSISNISAISSTCASCEGLIGIFSTGQRLFAALILESIPCTFISEGVRKVTEIGIVQINRGLSKPVYDDDLFLIRNTLARHSFYFSTGSFDVSRTFQANAFSKSDNSQDSWILRGDSRYIWNINWAGSVIAAGGVKFTVPVVNAWATCTPLEYRGETHNLTLITRRSRFRQGLRCGLSRLAHISE
jgi:hypothetical protein